MKGLRFERRRSPGDFGGIKIAVAVKRPVFFLSTMLKDGFEVFPDGKVEVLREPVCEDD